MKPSNRSGTFKINPRLLDRVRELAQREGRHVGWLVEDLINLGLESRKSEETR